MTLLTSDYISAAAIIVSIVAIIISTIIGIKQNKYQRRQDELNKIYIEKEKREINELEKADIYANVVRISSDKTRIRISNRGKAAAYKVNFELLGEDTWMVFNNGIFPFEMMEPGKTIDLPMAMTAGDNVVQRIKLTWSDFTKKEYSVEYSLTI